MENFPPQRRRKSEDPTNISAAMYKSNCRKQESEMLYGRNNKRSECPAAAVAGVDELRGKHKHDEYDESLEYRCPGTMDILSGRMVPCSAAPTLREIALGRRMRRTVVDAPECQPAKETRLSRRLKIRSVERTGEKNEDCRCKWNEDESNYDAECLDKRGIKMQQRKPEACCTRKRKVMSCNGGGSENGAFPKRYESGCNCSRGQRHTEESGSGSGASCKPETKRYQMRGPREASPRAPTGGCGRPQCPMIVYPPPEPPEVEWEYTNYNRINHRWPLETMDNVYPDYEEDYIDEKQGYQSDNYEEFEGEEKIPENCIYSKGFDEDFYQPCERFAGGCDNFVDDSQNYLDYYYEKESVDQQKPNAERAMHSCRKCSESRSVTDSDPDDNREKRKVHF